MNINNENLNCKVTYNLKAPFNLFQRYIIYNNNNNNQNYNINVLLQTQNDPYQKDNNF